MPFVSRTRQAGLSMISLMVGLLLAMISILAGMTLYQNIVRTSVETRTDAAQDGQMASAILSLQLELQAAGFGLAAGASPHIVLVGAPGNPQSLYWRYQPITAGTPTCKGFRIKDRSIDGIDHRQFQLISPSNSLTCTDVAVLESLDWSDDDQSGTVILADFRASAAADADLPVVSIALGNQSCFPYGMGQAGVYKQVTIAADNAARRAAIKAGTAEPNAQFVHNFCLSNIQ